MKRIGVVSSGYGVNDGNDIHEAVLAFHRPRGDALCFALDNRSCR
ncbi:MAG: Glyoxalase ElbB [Sodalis sp.]|nr:MAG: Glyoxalase ElbB [Sodalis sp.]